jgi:hypothetical protein
MLDVVGFKRIGCAGHVICSVGLIDKLNESAKPVKR